MNENLPPKEMKRLMKEIFAISKNPPEGIKVSIEGDNITDIRADIEGPVGTPFEGGVFTCKLILGQDFPQVPPKGVFTTKIFHPNVSKTGEICVNTLKKDWVATHGIQHILIVIRCLLIHPNPESALNEDAGKMLLENYDEFHNRARLMTQIHAKPKKVVQDDDGDDTTKKNKTSDVTKKSKAKSKKSQESAQTIMRCIIIFLNYCSSAALLIDTSEDVCVTGGNTGISGVRCLR